MDRREQVARACVLDFLATSASRHPHQADEMGVAISILTQAWQIDNPVLPPGAPPLLEIVRWSDPELGLKLKSEGNAAVQVGNWQLALAKYTEAIDADPTQAAFYSNRALVRSKIGEHEAAIVDAEKAIALDPKFASGYLRLGFALVGLGRRKEAEVAYRRGVAACPENAALRQALEDLAEQGSSPPPGGAGGFPGGFPGGGGGGFPGGGPGGGMGGLFQQVGQVLQKPEFQAFLASDPEVAQLLQSVQANPAMLLQCMGTPAGQRLMGAVMRLASGG